MDYYKKMSANSYHPLVWKCCLILDLDRWGHCSLNEKGFPTFLQLEDELEFTYPRLGQERQTSPCDDDAQRISCRFTGAGISIAFWAASDVRDGKKLSRPFRLKS